MFCQICGEARIAEVAYCVCDWCGEAFSSCFTTCGVGRAKELLKEHSLKKHKEDSRSDLYGQVPYAWTKKTWHLRYVPKIKSWKGLIKSK